MGYLSGGKGSCWWGCPRAVPRPHNTYRALACAQHWWAHHKRFLTSLLPSIFLASGIAKISYIFFFSGALPDTGGPALSEAHSKNSQVSNLTGHWRIQGAPGPYGELCDMLPVVIEVFHPNQKNLKVLSLAHLEAASLTLQGWLLKCTFPGLAFSQS